MDAASSSSDDGGDEHPDEARFIEEMYKAQESITVDPENIRRQEVMEEVARRRNAVGAEEQQDEQVRSSSSSSQQALHGIQRITRSHAPHGLTLRAGTVTAQV